MKKLLCIVLLLFSVGQLVGQTEPQARKIPNRRVVLPYTLEVSYDKTVHLIMPSTIRYVDLGNNNLIAGKAQDAENVLRVKATQKDFSPETNLSVICDDGSFYSFNVSYNANPSQLNIEMKDFLSNSDYNSGRLPSNKAEIYFKELGNQSPMLVKLLMKTIHDNNNRDINHIGVKEFGVRSLLRGLYAHNGLLYFHLNIVNESSMPYDIDFISFRIVDKVTAERTAIQEQVIKPIRSYNQVKTIKGYSSERIVIGTEQFSLSNDKQLEISLYEKNGGRKLSYYVQNEDLVLAESIENLKLKW